MVGEQAPVILQIAVLGVRVQTSNALRTARKIRDTETFTCRSPLLHVYVVVCTGQSMKDEHTWNKFLSVSCFELLLVQR